MHDADKIHIDLAYGNEIKRLDLSQAMGGGDSYAIYIDRFYRRSIINYCTGWKVVWNNGSPFGWTAFENEMLMEILIDHWKRTGHGNYEEMMNPRTQYIILENGAWICKGI